MNLNSPTLRAMAALVLLAILGCVESSTPSLGPSPLSPGLYVGTSAQNGDDVAFIVGADGTTWGLYTPNTQQFPGITYLFQGAGTITPGTFKAAALGAYGAPWAAAATGPVALSAQTLADGSFIGTLTGGPAPGNFTTRLRTAPSGAYIADLAGSYTQELTVMDGTTGLTQDRTFSITVQPNGRISGTFATQNYDSSSQNLQVPSTVTGSITLRADGSSFDVVVTVANADKASTSVLDGMTFTGAGYYDRTSKYLGFGALRSGAPSGAKAFPIAFEAPGPGTAPTKGAP